MSQAPDWFDARIHGAPPALLERVRQCLAEATAGSLGEGLAEGGERALRDAVHRGTGRDAALDLLAADALITLALLECAEREPARLGDRARELRHHAAVAE